MDKLHEILAHQAATRAESVALWWNGCAITYAQLNERVLALAARLASSGGAGERVAVLAWNCPRYVELIYAVPASGKILVPLNARLAPAELHYQLVSAGVTTLFGEPQRLEPLLQEHDFGPELHVIDLQDEYEFWLASGDQAPMPHTNARDTIWILYTSGSTGSPKGAMLSHRNIVSNVCSICQYLHLTEKDIQMVVLPFFYVMGKSLLNTHIAVGGTVVINNKFAFTASVVKEMVDEKVTGFSGVPSTYAYLLYRSPLASYRDRLGSLRYCSQAGGHMSKKLKQELAVALPKHTKIYIMYGVTEASGRLTYLEPDCFEDKLDSIGKPISDVTLRVVDEKGNEVPVGRTGELVASGPNIMSGYWNDVKATVEVLDENGYHTGDLGYQDEEGYFYVIGRNDNLIKVNGHRINPQEIEDVIMETELVIEAVVLGIPDAIKGHRMIALATPKRKDCTPDQILSACSEILPGFKLPKEINLVRALPKNMHGKIDRTKCLDLIT